MFLRYEKNEEKENRLSFFTKAALGITAGAFFLRESGDLKSFGKLANDVLKTTSKVSRDLEQLSIKEMDSENIGRIFKENVIGEKSLFKTLRKSTVINDIDHTKGLFAALRDFEAFKSDLTRLQDKIFDNVQSNEVMKNMRDHFKNENKEFFEQLKTLTDDVLKRKQQFFEEISDENGIQIKAIKEEFDKFANQGIFEDKGTEIASIFEDTLRYAEEMKSKVNLEYRQKLKPQLEKVYKEEILNKYSKDESFFKGVIDQAATVNDFLTAYEKGNIETTQANEEMNQLLKTLVSENKEAGNLFLDPSRLRLDKDKNMYSLGSIQNIADYAKEQIADTIPGKLFNVRSSILNKNAPDFYYIGQGTFDPILSNLSGGKNGLMKYDFFKIGEKFFEYKEGTLFHFDKADDLYLIGGKHGTQADVLNTLSGNTYYKTPLNDIFSRFDIGTKGFSKYRDRLAQLNKFNKSSNWGPNVVNRLLDGTYDGALTDSYLMSKYFKDLRLLNKNYNDNTLAPSLQFLKEYGNRLKPNTESKYLINSLFSDNIIETIINDPKIDESGFINKDLKSLVRKYRNNKQNISDVMHVGNSHSKKFANKVFTYDDLLKREVFKETLLREASTRGNTRISGYSVIKSLIQDLNTTGAQKRNAKDILNWSILQHEGNLFSADYHMHSKAEYKANTFTKLREILKTNRNNAQEQSFVESFRKGLKDFQIENSSMFETMPALDPRVMKPYEKPMYMTMRKGITPNDLLKAINDDTKFNAKAKAFIKQLYAGRDNMNDVTNFTLLPFHMINRLVTPLESLGLGFSRDNTKSSLDLIKNIGLKRILPAVAIGYGFSWLNDTTRDITGTSLTGAYQNSKARFNLGLKTILDKTPINTNGSIASMYNPIAAYWGTDYKTKEEYYDYLQNGYDPIRKGRFWDFGSTSELRGGKISYFRPNRYRLVNSNYYDISVYGSSSEKWAHSWIPTPTHPFSPIRALLDPNWLEKKHYEDRPYPVTGEMFSENTPWGIILNPTVGRILKPRRKMHEKELGGTLTDVRTLIANRNEEIRNKSTERNIAKLNSSGFINMAFNPKSMPSLSEAVFSLSFANGKVTSAGFQGQQYAETLPNANAATIPTVSTEKGVITDTNTKALTAINASKGSSVSNSDFKTNVTNIANNLIYLASSSGGIQSGTAQSMVASVNNSIFAKSEIKRQGAMNENYKAYIEPANKRSEKLKNDYLEKMVDYSSKNEFVHNLIYSTSELSGMYGFLGETLIPRSKGYQMEKANMGSFSNRFWDASVGGLGGDAMEIARRFFPHEDHNITQINPIKNTMPDWIPEKFRTGDPYAKVPLGDARLPGKGYESLNKLHSDKYGRYGAFDRYKILSDIAPLSEQYKIWRKIAKTEVKDPYLLKQMEEIDKRVEEQTKEHDFYNYRFIGKHFKTIKGTVEEVNDSGTFKMINDPNTYTLAGLTPLRDKNKQSYIHNYLKPGMKVSLQYEDNEYRNRDDNGNIPTLIYSDGESVTKRMFEDKTGKEKKNKDTLADQYYALSKGNITMGHVYEAIGHMPIPYIHNKYLRIDSSLESYRNEQIYGTSYATWSHPIKGFIKPAFQKAWSNNLGFQVLGLSTFMLSNIASRSEWNKGAKLASHAAFALTNPGGFAGGVLGFIPKMSFSKGMRTTANIGAIVGFGGYAMTHLNNPLLSAGNFAAVGLAAAKQFKFKGVSEGKGALIGAAIGLGLSAIKNPQFNLTSMNKPWIPKDTKKKWDIEEYYDRLEYLKYENLYKKAARLAKSKEGINIEKIINSFEINREKNVERIRKLQAQREKINKNIISSTVRDSLTKSIDYQISRLSNPEQYFQVGKYTKSAIAYKKAMDTTIYGLNDYSSQSDVLRALPKYDRDFFLDFAKEKDPKERKKILNYVSPYKRKALKVLWKENLDEGDKEESNYSYFKQHKLPGLFWSGWDPGVDLDNTKMKTIQNEGMLLSDFNMYDSQTNEPAYKIAPQIKNYNQGTSCAELAKNIIGLLNGAGLQNVDVSVDQTNDSGIQVISNITRITKYELGQRVSSILNNII